MPYIDSNKVDKKTAKRLASLIEKSYGSYWKKKRIFDIIVASMLMLVFSSR